MLLYRFLDDILEEETLEEEEETLEEAESSEAEKKEADEARKDAEKRRETRKKQRERHQRVGRSARLEEEEVVQEVLRRVKARLSKMTQKKE